jgi:hypothetical protein
MACSVKVTSPSPLLLLPNVPVGSRSFCKTLDTDRPGEIVAALVLPLCVSMVIPGITCLLETIFYLGSVLDSRNINAIDHNAPGTCSLDGADKV